MAGTHQNGGMRIQYSSNNCAQPDNTKENPIATNICWHSKLNFKGEKITSYIKETRFSSVKSLVLHHTEL
jgi:hypothetical protein